MQKITLTTTNRTDRYDIVIGVGVLKNLNNFFDFSPYSQTFIVTDQNVGKLLLDSVAEVLPIAVSQICLPAGEQSKNLRSVENIWTAMHRAECDRKTLVIALGGGVIGDMAGFAASTYMRGVDCLQIPTTLLSQADACVGGKTGIDLCGIKNLVGTFKQPVGIVMDTQTLTTLPEREFVSGFAEIIKAGLIRDVAYYKQVTSKRPLDLQAAELEGIIAQACRLKAAVVQRDPLESAERKVLNFGHTIGHAIEALSLETKAPLLHGEAVSIGIGIEADISNRLGLLGSEELQSIKEALDRAGLPITSPVLEVAAILQKMRSDKKNERGRVKFTLLQGIGKAVWDREADEPTVVAAIEANMEKRI